MFGELLGRINRMSIWAQAVKVGGRRMRATSLDRWVYLWLQKYSLMGGAERRFFEGHVKPGMTVVDVGANLGVYTVLFSRLVGDEGRVIAFEPDPQLFAALAENCAGMDNVTLHNAAVGARSERRLFCPGVLNSGDNRLVAVDASSDAQDGLRVNVVSLDDVVDGKVDFVKIDVQGWEMDVFRGMGGMLRSSVGLFFEYWPFGLREAGTNPEDILQFLTTAGFDVFQIEVDRLGNKAELSTLVEMTSKHEYINLYACRQVRVEKRSV